VAHHRIVPVPDGLVGERIDNALSKLMGFSRTFAAEIVAGGGVEIGGVVASKSDRLAADTMMSITWEDKREPTVVAAHIPEMSIVYDDEHIVIVDKPPFLAAHPSLGWEGDTVVGALAGAGYRISTSRTSRNRASTRCGHQRAHDCRKKRDCLFGDEGQIP
jgi:23S rRNA pseudouridine1911/1915/1917 synthase